MHWRKTQPKSLGCLLHFSFETVMSFWTIFLINLQKNYEEKIYDSKDCQSWKRALKNLYFSFNSFREMGVRGCKVEEQKVTASRSQATSNNFAPKPGLNPSLESIPGHSCSQGHRLWEWPFLLGCWLFCSFYHLKLNHEMEEYRGPFYCLSA